MLRHIQISRKVHRSNRHGNRIYSLWQCHCGKTFEAENSNVATGNTTSCGCMKYVGSTKAHITHNMSHSKTYRSWAGMKERCTNKHNKRYKDYGGRGITFCKKWETFDGFLEDMGEQPTGKSIDRIDNNGNYCKKNCRWATVKEQCNNTRKNVYVSFNGITKTISQWSEALGIPRGTISNRIKANWSLERVFSTKNH